MGTKTRNTSAVSTKPLPRSLFRLTRAWSISVRLPNSLVGVRYRRFAGKCGAAEHRANGIAANGDGNRDRRLIAGGVVEKGRHEVDVGGAQIRCNGRGSPGRIAVHDDVFDGCAKGGRGRIAGGVV